MMRDYVYTKGLQRSPSEIIDNMEEERERKQEMQRATGSRAQSSTMNPTAAPFYPRQEGRQRQPSGGAGAATSSAVTEDWLSQAAAAPRSLDGRFGTSPGPSYRDSKDTPFSVTEEFNHWRSKAELAVAVAAIKALCGVIRASHATTMMGLEKDLKEASEVLKAWDKTSISLSAGCDLFMRYVTRTSGLEYEDISAGKARLIERGERFSEISSKSRKTIAMLGQDFVRDGNVILTHGFSRVTISLLKMAATMGKTFHVVCTEGRPGCAAVEIARELAVDGISMTVILDSAVAFVMERVDMVLVGAEGVVESGGIINRLGTYQIAVVARALNKPVYVAAESYKFARLYPLNQRDLPANQEPIEFPLPLPESVTVENPALDYTPPHLLTLLFTDLGVLTPSAVSDELIQLYL